MTQGCFPCHPDYHPYVISVFEYSWHSSTQMPTQMSDRNEVETCRHARHMNDREVTG
jgi:hypothetical protein